MDYSHKTRNQHTTAKMKEYHLSLKTSEDGGQRKPPTCCKSLTNFISGMKTKLNVNFVTTGLQNIVHCRVTYVCYIECHTVCLRVVGSGTFQ